MELTVDTLEFDLDKIPQRFVLINNMEQYGLKIEDEFADWINHSADLTPENFCKFIRVKHKDVICITEEVYHELYA